MVTERGHDASGVDAAEGPSESDLEGIDAFLVGAPIRLGEHRTGVSEVVRTNHGTPTHRPAALFQLSMSSAATDDARRAEAAAYVDEFLEGTDRVGLFGGGLRYSVYGLLKRFDDEADRRRDRPGADASRDPYTAG